MASPSYALRRIRSARRRASQPSMSDFTTYREEYETTLRALYDLGGDDLIDDISWWIIVQTIHDGMLPVPETVTERARELVKAQSIAIPPESALADRG